MGVTTTTRTRRSTKADIGIIAGFLTGAVPAGWLRLDGQVIPGGAAAYPDLAALYPEWATGADLTLPNVENGTFLRMVGPVTGAVGSSAGFTTRRPVNAAFGFVTTTANGVVTTTNPGNVPNGHYGLRVAGAANSVVANGGTARAAQRDTTRRSHHHPTIEGGGDIETRPINVAVVYAVKAVPTVVARGRVSDLRLKEEVRPVGELDISWLAPVVYERDGERHAGWVAQVIREHAPEAVTEGPDGLLRVDESKIVPILWAKALELKAKLDARRGES